MTSPHLQLVDEMIAAAPAGTGSTGGAAASARGEYPLSHYGNTARFVTAHANDLRYDAARGCYLYYDGMRFAPDTVGQVHQLAQAIIKANRADAIAEPDLERQRRLFRWADKCESQSATDQVMSLAKSHPSIARTPADWDANPDVANAQNGIIDLRDGSLSPHDRDAHHTKLIPIAYDPTAACPRWDAFLTRVVPDPLVRTLLQVAAGYSLTGHTSEQVLMLLLGIGRNGKSVFINTLRQLAGEYAVSADFETFLDRGTAGGAARGDLARLHGARIVTTSEAGEGKRLNESLIKSITGGDTITARFLYAREFEFIPQFMIWMAANHRPVIKGSDDGIWRRFLLVPFTVQIPADEVDKSLPDALKAELPGILAWAVRGAMQWYREGLVVPAVVRAATDAYREESDTLAEFIEECCHVRADTRAQAGDLYLAYTRWVEPRGETPMTNTAFGRKLTDRGIPAEKDGGKKYRVGVSLRGAWRSLAAA